MSTALEHIKKTQIDWAVSRQIHVDSGGYALSLDDNLFCPLSRDSVHEFRSGKGDELGVPGARGKMQALHSSAALVVNVFEYWRKKDVAAIAKACGAVGKISIMHYEATHANALGGIPSHLDVEFSGSSSASVRFAIEAKFTETYYRHTRRTLARSYLDKPGLWKGLPGCERLAHQLRDEEGKRTSFEYLDAPQLLKHILGLATEFGPKGFALLYLWYGLQSLEANRHWREIIEFENMITSDVDFRVMTYQDLFASILRMPIVDQSYLDYLKTRYFSEGYNSFRDKMVAAEDKYGALAGNLDKLKGRMLGLKQARGFGGTEHDIVSQLDVEVRDGLRVIRISGLTDKMNYRKAANIVGGMGFDKAASWIRKNSRLYQQLVARGFMNLSQSLTTGRKEGQE